MTAGRLAFDFAAGMTVRGCERSGALKARGIFLVTVGAGQPVGCPIQFVAFDFWYALNAWRCVSHSDAGNAGRSLIRI